MNRTIISCIVLFVASLHMDLKGQESYYSDLDAFLQEIIFSGTVDYHKSKSLDAEMESLISTISDRILSENEIADQINLYNLLVVKKISMNYPVSSVQKIPGFFTDKIITIGNEEFSLNSLEAKIFKQSPDARIHMVLICGARGCPPFQNFAFRNEILDKQLDFSCRSALHTESFFKISGDRIHLSEIFKWYADDFISKGSVRSFIDSYRLDRIPSEYTLLYYPYDWSVNDKNTDTSKLNDSSISSDVPRYFASTLYGKGAFEIHLFNNYYRSYLTSKGDRNDSWDFFSSFLQVLLGSGKRINFGFDLKFRSVNFNAVSRIPTFSGLHFEKGYVIFNANNQLQAYKRSGLTAVGPKIKYHPFKNLRQITLQHTLYIPLAKELGGKSLNGFQDYLDWNAPSLFSQLFYDQYLTPKFSLFAELDFIIENMDRSLWRLGGGYHQISTPATIIVNYFATDKLTFYSLYGAAPVWAGSAASKDEINYSYVPYGQLGLGVKYFIVDQVQAEILLTRFYNPTDHFNGRTFNFGIRYFKWNQ